ncbi:MAG TPA: acetate--CoA ligase family protein [Bacteroidia bacterium]
MNNLKYILEPKSVAVIGASERRGTIGYAIFSNILTSNFKGVVYPVNPKYTNIMSVKSYNNVSEISDKIDLAILSVPINAVEEVIKQCASKNVKGLVIITAGFKETGSEGKKLEDRIAAIANEYNISLIGPNCLGVVNTAINVSLNATFTIGMPYAGKVALISQSGAVGIAALDYAQQHELGISKFISIGNKAVIDESDILEYLIDDEETKVITMYVEDITRPNHFFKMAKRANEKQKPIIVIKTGRSVRGAQAIHSHTGALSSSDTAYDSLFAQCGVIRVTELAELFEYAKGFTCLVEPKGKRVVILTNAGGMGIITTDAIERNHLEMTSFEEGTKNELKKLLPTEANIHNPVDVIGDADAKRIADTLAIIVKDKNMDALIVSIVPTIKTNMDEIALSLCKIAKENPRLPILSNLMALEPDPAFEKVLEQANIPNFNFPEINVRTLSVMINYYQSIKQTKELPSRYPVNEEQARSVLQFVRKEKRIHLSEAEGYKILEAYGFKALDYRVTKNIEDALVAASQVGYPVVMKIVSSDILHKVDVGGVQINLKDENEVRKAFTAIGDNVKKLNIGTSIQGFLIQKYFTGSGIEVIIGSNAIKGFGSLIMFGLGGTMVELFKDVSFRLAPLTKQDALSMIMETKGYQILKGYRGHAPYNIEAIVDCLLRLSQLVTDFPEIVELDMNPIKVLEDGLGVVVMDAKAILAQEADSLPTKQKETKEREFAIA